MQITTPKHYTTYIWKNAYSFWIRYEKNIKKYSLHIQSVYIEWLEKLSLDLSCVLNLTFLYSQSQESALEEVEILLERFESNISHSH